ncbi:MAG: TRAM domain-containing protein [Bacillota bacterium]|nr:TRAM domain-containing protein [Bacillota bacterium]
MSRKGEGFLKSGLFLLGLLVGYELASYLIVIPWEAGWKAVGGALAKMAALTLAFGLASFLLAPYLLKGIGRLLNWVTGSLQRMAFSDIAAGVIGLTAALLIALLFTLSFPRRLPVVGDVLPLLFTIGLGYVGAAVAIKKREELFAFLSSWGRAPGRFLKEGGAWSTAPKLLDTSAIIDGRIFDICKSGFLEGNLIVPQFVLAELQHIADSSDVLKRNKGRRGLDILNKMQKELHIPVQIIDADLGEAGDVDARIVRLAKALGAKVVTNDFNLNKVCELQGVKALNINELANAVKPIVLPGEEMVVQVVRDGREPGQGLAYLDDGTMIVVDGGKKYIGETVGVLVTNVLSTSGGRMIFARPKAVEKAL